MRIFFHFLIALSVLSISPLIPRQTQVSFAADTKETCVDCQRIGILPFKYGGNEKNIALYAQGTQDSLIYALSTLKHLVIIDRSKTNQVLKEITFQQTSFADKKTQVKIGKMLGVDFLYTGSIQEVNGRLRIIIERIHVATGEVKALTQVTGKTEALFELQDKVAQSILKQMKIPTSAEELKIVSQKIKSTQSVSAYEYFFQGLVEYGNKEYKKAVISYTKCIEIDPKYGYAYNNRGAAYKYLKEYKKAFADFSKSIEFAPEYAHGYYNRGTIYQKSKQYKKALADYTQAIKIDPQYISAYRKKGNIYLELEAYKRAIKDYTQAIELKPQYVYSYYNRGLAYFFLKQYKEAKADFSKSCNMGFKTGCKSMKLLSKSK